MGTGKMGRKMDGEITKVGRSEGTEKGVSVNSIQRLYTLPLVALRRGGRGLRREKERERK